MERKSTKELLLETVRFIFFTQKNDSPWRRGMSYSMHDSKQWLAIIRTQRSTVDRSLTGFQKPYHALSKDAYCMWTPIFGGRNTTCASPVYKSYAIDFLLALGKPLTLLAKTGKLVVVD